MMKEGHAKVLAKERYYIIKAGLQTYRLDSFIRTIDKQKGSNKGAILSFVRGLRFSALLIYAIREILSGSNLTANWGHIIDEDGELCSRECDIIIHKKGHYSRWNGGNPDPIMDFRFILQQNAIVVISCKSFLEKSKIEQDYCTDMKRYVDQVWLFAECCGPKSVKIITEEAYNIGYNHFFHLYTWNKSTDTIEDAEKVWFDFVEKIELLKL
ncbi:MAG: hypothetical protein IPN94_00030 [Sphingobacteriales bacterium]|jgi:hypothetical protein|nr:hypothetical protein [Sphingobacteriales bacterium]